MRYSDQTRANARVDLLHVLPVSAIEQHGPHLPASTDALIVEGLVEAIDGVDEFVDGLLWLPHLYYGTSEEHQDLHPTLSLRPETLLAVLDDIFRSLAGQGVKNVAILNGHGGNVPVLQASARNSLVRWGVRTYFLRPLSILPSSHGGSIEMHAGALETSLLLHLKPDLVRVDQVPSVQQMKHARSNLLLSMTEGNAPQFAWRTKDLSTNGVIGEPSKADAEYGKELFDLMVRYLMQEIQQIRTSTQK